MDTAGYIQVYTGDGKGKTTAALGLALRAVGAGFHVYFGQFMKTGDTSEAKALRTFAPQVMLEHYGTGNEFACPDAAADRAAAQHGYAQALAALQSGSYDVVILDEINVATHLCHVDEAQTLALLSAKPTQTELILTGRWAAQSVIDRADLVTEMHECKHYFAAGVPARVGIEY